LSECEQKHNCGNPKTSRNNRTHGSLPHVPYFASKQRLARVIAGSVDNVKKASKCHKRGSRIAHSPPRERLSRAHPQVARKEAGRERGDLKHDICWDTAFCTLRQRMRPFLETGEYGQPLRVPEQSRNFLSSAVQTAESLSSTNATIIHNSARWRLVFEFSARKFGPIV
jgi:hypothetical protein